MSLEFNTTERSRNINSQSLQKKVQFQNVKLQPKLFIGSSNDQYEVEADRMADQVVNTQSKEAVTTSNSVPLIQKKCASCEEEEYIQKKPLAETITPLIHRSIAGSGGGTRASDAISSKISDSRGRGSLIENKTRSFMEHGFGADFSNVRVHTDSNAISLNNELNAQAFTVGNDIYFNEGKYQPNSNSGKHLLAHELTHTVQQGRVKDSDTFVQRVPSNESEAKKLVQKGEWCRDSKKSGQLHPNDHCYREIPEPVPLGGDPYPPGDQVCFDKKTGQKSKSPDYVSAVSGQNKDGTCDIPMSLWDPPHPFNRRGRRALGHFGADILTEDPHLTGKYFGSLSGVALGIVSPKLGFNSRLESVLFSAIFGYLGGRLGAHSLPILHRHAQKHGYLPNIGLSLGGDANLGVSLGLGVGYDKRLGVLPLVPVNTYFTFGFNSSLSIGDEPSTNFTFQTKIGFRMDPGKDGGVFGLGSVGAGLNQGRDISGVTSKEFGVGYRATEFLDVQVVRETISNGRTPIYWLTLKIIAPKRTLILH